MSLSLRAAAGLFLAFSLQAAPGGVAPELPAGVPREPEWKVMDYGPFLSASLEVAPGNIANKGIAIRLDSGEGGVSRGREFLVFETDTLRAAAGWSGTNFVDWKNIAFDGAHEVHMSILGERSFTNPDAPGWGNALGRFDEERVLGRDGQRYGPLPRGWAHWNGLYVHGQQVVLSYTVGGTDILEMPGAEGPRSNRALTRTFSIGPRVRPLTLQVAHGNVRLETDPGVAKADYILIPESGAPGEAQTGILLVGGLDGMRWSFAETKDVRLEIPAGDKPVRFKLLFTWPSTEVQRQVEALRTTHEPIVDLALLTRGGPRHWTETTTTKAESSPDARFPYQIEGISLPVNNPYHCWMRPGGFDFFKDGRRAAVCTWQGDVWLVDGLGGPLNTFRWTRIASGLFQPLGLKIVDEVVFVTGRDQITALRDLNADGETDFYQNFNNDAQVTEHFHEFAMDLQTDQQGNFYYAKGARHAKDALVPQHGTLLRVSRDGLRTDIVASGFRAPNGVCVNDDGTFIVSDQEGHWTPENRINWVKPGGFYGYMMGFHEARSSDDFLPPIVWIHKSLDRSPAEQLRVKSASWGPIESGLLSLSYGTGKIFAVMTEQVGGVMQGGVVTMPIPPLPTGVMRGRFNPADGQLYVAGLFGWASDKTRPGGYYRIRFTGKPVHLPLALHATRQGMLITFSTPLEAESASDPENYAITRWTYRRTANYGSDDYRLSQPEQRGRDTVQLSGVKLSPDKRSVLLEIQDMQPSPQMEIKYNIQSEDGAKLFQWIENTIHVVGGEAKFENLQNGEIQP